MTVADLAEQLAKLQEQLEALARENKILREENALLKRGLYGRSSERIEPGQLALYGDLSSVAPDSSPVEAKPERERRAKPGHGRDPFPAHLPRKVIQLVVPEDKRCCPDCGDAMQPIGVDTSERGHIVPAKMVVNEYRREKLACPHGHGVVTAPTAPGAVEGAKYEPSVYAHVITSKYADHLPLNRIQGIYKRFGIHFPKQTMWDMVARYDELVAAPVLEQMRLEILAEPVLQADETPITLRVEGGRGSTQGWAWLWSSLAEPGPAKVLVEFKESRGRDGPRSFLKGAEGILLVDGYAGYDNAIAENGLVRAGCWAHARRYVKDALDTGSQAALRLLRPIQRLFRLERAVNRRAEALKLSYKDRLALRSDVRERRSRRIFASIITEAETLELDRSTLPKSKLGKAIGYALRQRQPLASFLEDARLPIHNNDAERHLRHLAVGRKNWMVFGSKRGGEVGCRLYSLVLSAKAAGINVEEYLRDLLTRIDDPKDSDLATYTPWAWAAARGSSVS